MKRTTVTTRGYLLVGPKCLLKGKLLGKGNNNIQLRIEAVNPVEEYLCQLYRGQGSCPDEVGKFGNGIKSQVIPVFRALRYLPASPIHADTGFQAT